MLTYITGTAATEAGRAQSWFQMNGTPGCWDQDAWRAARNGRVRERNEFMFSSLWLLALHILLESSSASSSAAFCAYADRFFCRIICNSLSMSARSRPSPWVSNVFVAALAAAVGEASSSLVCSSSSPCFGILAFCRLSSISISIYRRISFYSFCFFFAESEIAESTLS